MMSIKFTPLTRYYGWAILGIITPTTWAEVITDGTLGPSSALPGPEFAIPAELGQQVGGNLFHSFQQFNLNSQETATFDGPTTVKNIISRVTGGERSYLDGTLRATIPQVDVYLLNPAGVIFGPHAKLDLPGSFAVSTADYLRLGESGIFSATAPPQSTLTVAAPSAFGFLSDSPAGIAKEQGFLNVRQGHTLSWIGGELKLQNSKLVVGDLAERADGSLDYWYPGGGVINLVSVAAPGEVPVNPEDWPLTKFGKLGNITITNTTVGQRREVANLDASGSGGGKIGLWADKLVLDNGYVFADTWGHEPGQGIAVLAQTQLLMQHGSRITTEAVAHIESSRQNKGAAGSIQITTGQLHLSAGSQIASTSQTAGNAGQVKILATDRIELTGRRPGAELFNSGIVTHTFANGAGGKVELSAPLVILDQGGVIMAGSPGGIGDAGNVTVQADKLLLASGGHISVSAGTQDSTEKVKRGLANGGQLTVQATQSISISGQGLTGEGNSGLRSNTYTAGNGGDITVAAPEIILQAGGSIQAGAEGKGKAGNITIEGGVEQLSLLGGTITTESKLSGGGNISLQPSQLLYVLDGKITAEAMGEQPSHRGGNLTIGQLEHRSPFVILGPRSSLKANAYKGNGGVIDLVAENYIKSEEGVVLDASSQLGEPGVVSIDAFKVDLTKGFARLSTKTFKPLKLLSHRCPIGPKQNSFNVFKLESAYPNPVDLQFYQPEFSEVGL